jgi:hypothetical protein
MSNVSSKLVRRAPVRNAQHSPDDLRVSSRQEWSTKKSARLIADKARRALLEGLE